MKNLFFTVWPVWLFFVAAIAIVKYSEPSSKANPEIAMCSSPSGLITKGKGGKYIPALPGWGNFQYPISTRNDSAQFYFNQGLSFYYGYHFTEALASFKEAGRFDPSCAMAYWGQALAMGPYYNTYVYKMSKDVPGVVVAALNASPASLTEKEKALIHAISQRYSNDLTNSDRVQLNRNYAVALGLLVKKYPDDNNMKALYIDAVMLEHKWDFWYNDGTPKPWTPELVTLCEEVLRADAHHPAILHYYIHLTEASRQSERALPSADLLKEDLPGIAHMVHMSSHMYQRNGLYAKGVKVNEDASSVNNDVDTRAPHLSIGKDKSIHYYAVQSYCAMTAGMYSQGIPVYERARAREIALRPEFEKDMYAQFVYMIPVTARVRLGKWEEILRLSKPGAEWKYALALDDFAKGLAHVHHNRLSEAKKCLAELNTILNDSLLAIRLMPFNSPLQSCKIASGILTGEIMFLEGKKDESLTAFRQAVEAEDQLVYREPQDWMIPARQYLGAYLLKMNRAEEAEKAYREDLVANPGNGWSLLGLYQSLEAQNKKNEAASIKEKYIRAFEAADVRPTGSVF